MEEITLSFQSIKREYIVYRPIESLNYVQFIKRSWTFTSNIVGWNNLVSKCADLEIQILSGPEKMEIVVRIADLKWHNVTAFDYIQYQVLLTLCYVIFVIAASAFINKHTSNIYSTFNTKFDCFWFSQQKKSLLNNRSFIKGRMSYCL